MEQSAKTHYSEPDLEIILFDAEDTITTSIDPDLTMPEV